MAENQIEIKCPRCGRVWSEDLSALDEADRLVYKGLDPARDYRVHCPQCGAVKVITVAFEEDEGDE